MKVKFVVLGSECLCLEETYTKGQNLKFLSNMTLHAVTKTVYWLAIILAMFLNLPF